MWGGAFLWDFSSIYTGVRLKMRKHREADGGETKERKIRQVRSEGGRE